MERYDRLYSRIIFVEDLYYNLYIVKLGFVTRLVYLLIGCIILANQTFYYKLFSRLNTNEDINLGFDETSC